jgi:hypothetical protein
MRIDYGALFPKPPARATRVIGYASGAPEKTQMDPAASRPSGDEPPPFLGNWARVYAAVLCYLALLILALYTVSRLFRY